MASKYLSSVPSLVFGPTHPPLWNKTVLQVLQEQLRDNKSRTAVIFPWQQHISTFNDLGRRSAQVAKALLGLGIKSGHHTGLMAGNRFEFIDVFLGGARIGCPVVILNVTYTVGEMAAAVDKTDCCCVFIADKIGSRDMTDHLRAANKLATDPHARLKSAISVERRHCAASSAGMMTYDGFLNNETSVPDAVLAVTERDVMPDDILSVQLTSGTTGSPKAAMLSHFSLINNGHLTGYGLRMTPDDIVCCPPPLFHCFGLVIEFLATLTHGAAIVFPSDIFNREASLNAIITERCTFLYGVPTMLMAIMDIVKNNNSDVQTLRAGLAAGTMIAPSLMKQVREHLQCPEMFIAYGMTETSPLTFVTSTADPEVMRDTSIGRVMPHTGAKVLDGNGHIVPRGQPGEICTSGYALQKGYYQNEAKTKEAMATDENGVRWMRTGDQGFLNVDGYAFITGRVKDIIICGGENIYPGEIEDCLMQHVSIAEASVVGVKDEKYGEVVGTFLRPSEGALHRPAEVEVQTWVMRKLGRQKAPKYCF